MSAPGKFSSRSIALVGLMSAVALVLLYLACLIPSGWAGVTAVAGLAVAVTVSAAGWRCGIMTYVVSGLLALILVPGKQVALLYVCMFGLYPVLKLFMERMGRKVPEYLLKLAYFNAVLVALYYAAYGLFFGDMNWGLPVPVLSVLIPVGSVVFLVYDYAFTKVMAMLQKRLIPQLRRRFSGS